MFRVVSVSVWAFVSSVKRIGDRTVRREFGQMNPVSQDEYVCKSECCVFCVCFFSWVGGGGMEKEMERERENTNSNSKSLFYKDGSLGSFKNLTTSPC